MGEDEKRKRYNAYIYTHFVHPFFYEEDEAFPEVGVKDSMIALAPLMFHVCTCDSMTPLSSPTVYVV